MQPVDDLARFGTCLALCRLSFPQALDGPAAESFNGVPPLMHRPCWLAAPFSVDAPFFFSIEVRMALPWASSWP